MFTARSLSESVLAKTCFATAITAASNNGTGIDARGFSRASFWFQSAPSGIGTTSDCKLQESADNSSWADVTSATFTQVTTAGGNNGKGQYMDVDLTKRLRYLRLVHTGVGASAAGVASAVALLYQGGRTPFTQDQTRKSV